MFTSTSEFISAEIVADGDSGWVCDGTPAELVAVEALVKLQEPDEVKWSASIRALGL